MGQANPGMGMACGCGMVIFSLVLIVWFVSLVFRVRDVIPANR
jgi:hypothetical protein